MHIFRQSGCHQSSYTYMVYGVDTREKLKLLMVKLHHYSNSMDNLVGGIDECMLDRGRQVFFAHIWNS